MMNTVTLNGNLIRNQKDFHQVIKHALQLPEYYGENLDALWDCLTSSIDLPLTIIWEDFGKSRSNLGDWTNKVTDLFKEAESDITGFYIEYR